MPDILTDKETKRLQKLADSKTLLYDRGTISQLLDIIQRQSKAIKAGDFRYSVLVIASQGLATEEEILAKGLPADLCDLAVDLRRQCGDAYNWRAMSAAENEQPAPPAPQPAPGLSTQAMIDILDDPARAN